MPISAFFKEADQQFGSDLAGNFVGYVAIFLERLDYGPYDLRMCRAQASTCVSTTRIHDTQFTSGMRTFKANKLLIQAAGRNTKVREALASVVIKMDVKSSFGQIEMRK